MKKIFGLALGLALFAGGARAQQVNQYGAAGESAVLTETELTDVVLFTNGRAEKGIVLEVTAGQPVRIIQADGIVHAYSPLLVDRIVRGCGVEILHTAAPAANMAAKDEPVESYDDKDGYYEETYAARAPRRAAARPAKGATHAAAAATRPAARRPSRGAQPVAPHRAQAAGAAARPAKGATHAAAAATRPAARRPSRGAQPVAPHRAQAAGAAARPRAARGAKRR